MQGAGTDVCICLSLSLRVWSPYLVQRFRALGPERGPPQSAFSPGLRSGGRALWELTAKVLANQPFEAAGEVFQRERAGSAQRPHRPKAEPSTAPALGEHGPDLAGLHWYCPMKGKAAGGVCRHARAPHRPSPVRAFLLGLGLS